MGQCHQYLNRHNVHHANLGRLAILASCLFPVICQYRALDDALPSQMLEELSVIQSISNQY